MAEPLSHSVTFSALEQRVTTLETHGVPDSITAENIETALGYVPANQGGDTFGGPVAIDGDLSITGTAIFGDSVFSLIFNGGTPIVNFDAGDYIVYDRSNNLYNFMIGSAAQMQINSGAVNVANVLTVGDGNFGMSLNSGSPYLAFDSSDFLGYDRANNIFGFNIGGAVAGSLTENGLSISGYILPGADNNYVLLMNGGNPVINFDASDCALHYTRGGSAGFYTFKIAGDERLTVTNAYTFAATALFAGDTNFGFDGSALATVKVRFDTGGDNIAFTRATNTLDFNIGGTSKMHVNAAGVTTSALTVDNAGGILVTNGGSGKGEVIIAPGDATLTGSIALLDPTGSQVAGIGPMTAAGVFGFIANNGVGFNFYGGPTSFQDLNFALDNNSGSPRVQFDTGDYLQYDRTANKLYFYVGGVAKASIDSSGNMKLAGTLTQSTTP